MKYVIKNCDNYTELGEDWTCRSTIQNRKGCYCCQDCTDCVLKQIVELCKSSIRKNERDIYRAGRMSLAINILGLLDIEDAEDENS